MARRPRAPHGALILLTLPLVLAACGTSSEGTAPADDPSTTVANPDAWFIEAGDLGGEWRDSPGGNQGFRQDVCGVDIEPEKPVEGEAIRFSQGPLGPFLDQHVRIHADDKVPAEVTKKLDEALLGCTSYSTKGTRPDSPTVRFTVEPLEVADLPEGAVAWRQQAQSGGRITSDVVLVPKGRTLIGFFSYAVKGDPDDKVLGDALSAVDAKVVAP